MVQGSRKQAGWEEEHPEDEVRHEVGEHQEEHQELEVDSLVGSQAEVVVHRVAEEHREVVALAHAEDLVEGATRLLYITPDRALQALWGIPLI